MRCNRPINDKMTPAVRIVEVGPRDGLQNIHQTVPTNIKIELIQRLSDAGLQAIELTSVVSPKAVPQLKDCKEVLNDARIKEMLASGAKRLPVLIPNLKGLQRAAQCGVTEIAVFVSATEGFSRANINCTVEEGFARARETSTAARKQGIAVRG